MMGMFATVSLAAGLSVDSLAAALATGVALRRPRLADAARVGVAFGVCQMAITLVGIGLGVALLRVVSAWDHWIAFLLLLAVGGQMVVKALSGDAAEPVCPAWPTLLAMGVGTSIDAGVVGIGLGMTEVNAPFTVAVIGVVTFGFSVAGVLCGCRVGRRAGTVAQVAGGLVLAALGARILAAHLLA